MLATPPGFRPLQYAGGHPAGKHIFMEKPCCVDGAGYRMLMAANKLADEKNLLVGVGLQRRHEPRLHGDDQAIHDGAHRRHPVPARLLERQRHLEPQARGGQDRNMTEMQYQVHNWYHFCWLSGDNICEQHIHNLDVGNWVKGDQHPVEANGMGGCTARYLGRNKGTGQIFDHHFVEFTYADGTKMFSQCRHMAKLLQHRGEFAHGTKGMTSQLRAAGSRPRAARRRLRKAKNATATSRSRSTWWRHSGRQALQRRLLRRQQQHDRRAGPPGDLLGKSGQVGRRRGQQQTEFPKSLAWDAPAPVQKDADGNYPIPMPGRVRAGVGRGLCRTCFDGSGARAGLPATAKSRGRQAAPGTLHFTYRNNRKSQAGRRRITPSRRVPQRLS